MPAITARPQAKLVTADASGNAPNCAGSGVGFMVLPYVGQIVPPWVENLPNDIHDSGTTNLRQVGSYPVVAFLDGDPNATYPLWGPEMVYPGAFNSISLSRATPRGTYLVWVFQSRDQAVVPVGKTRHTALPDASGFRATPAGAPGASSGIFLPRTVVGVELVFDTADEEVTLYSAPNRTTDPGWQKVYVIDAVDLRTTIHYRDVRAPGQYFYVKGAAGTSRYHLSLVHELQG